MRRPSLSFLFPLFLCIAVSTAHGQAAQSEQQSPSSPAQGPDSAHSQSAQTSAKPANQSRSQKVWTNEDMGGLRDHSAISTVGNAHAAQPNPNDRADRNVPHRNANWYRDQILKLRAKIPPLDETIQQLQAAIDGKTVDSVRKYWAVRADDWRDQLARLKKQREDIQARIAALEDEARHNGVPQNSLP